MFLEAALTEARRAGRRGEVPIGALVVRDGAVLGRGYNRPIGSHDPTAHAEVVAIRQAARRLGNYRLTGSELFVTVEPCLLCLGAILQARIGRVVYGAEDLKVRTLSGAEGLARYTGVNHHFEVRGGVLAEESRALVREFFARRRTRALETS